MFYYYYYYMYRYCRYKVHSRLSCTLNFQTHSKFTVELIANATCQTLFTEHTHTHNTHNHTMHIINTFWQYYTHVCAMRRLYFVAFQTSHWYRNEQNDRIKRNDQGNECMAWYTQNTTAHNKSSAKQQKRKKNMKRRKGKKNNIEIPKPKYTFTKCIRIAQD